MSPDVVIDLARSYAGEAVHMLVHLMRNATSESVKLSAAKAIIARAYGKPGKAAEKPSRNADIPAAPLPPAPKPVVEPVPPLAAAEEEKPARQPTAMELNWAWRKARTPEERAVARAAIADRLNGGTSLSSLNRAPHAPTPRA
jgi:hypothetical protein